MTTRYKPSCSQSNDLKSQDDSWQITYLDTFTLLLAFFIILSGLTGINLLVFEDYQKGLRSPTQLAHQVENLLGELLCDLKNLLEDEIKQGIVKIDPGEYEVRMHFRGSSFYQVGEANLLPGGRKIIDNVMKVVEELIYYQFNIDIEGHADNTPIENSRFPSNWELSAARASNIVRYLIESGYDPERLKASGYGDLFPIAANTDPLGNPIPENQDMNRRIVIRLFY